MRTHVGRAPGDGLRDCLLLERYHGTRRGRPFEALKLFAAKAEGQGLQVTTSDSEHGPLFLSRGGNENGRIVFSAQLTTRFWPVLLRSVYSAIETEGFVVENQRSVDGGETWDTVARAEYRRLSDSPPGPSSPEQLWKVASSSHSFKSPRGI